MKTNLKWLLLIPLLITVVALAYLIPKVFGGDSNGRDRTTKQQSQAYEVEVTELQGRIDAYAEILQRDPNDLVAIRGMGDDYLQKGFIEYEYGDVNASSRSYKAAVDHYRRYLSLKPDDVEVRIDLGLAYSYLGMFEVAVRELKAATVAAPTSQRAWHSLGWVLAQGDNSAEARQAWQKSFELNPNSAIGKESKQFLDQSAGVGTDTGLGTAVPPQP